MNKSGDIKVLIVDDSPTVRHQIKTILAKRPYQILEAKNGTHAIRVAFESHPDVALMDVQMPDMDGFECCRHIKHDPELKKIRVIMVTGENGYEQQTEAYRMGCNDYVTKPICDEELLEKLDKIVRFIQIARTAKKTIADTSKRPGSPI
ncbi:MAG: response regulator [Deltaproteobacteria bacterium]|nr:response regulator [Deltaproteobacteria bacterium]